MPKTDVFLGLNAIITKQKQKQKKSKQAFWTAATIYLTRFVLLLL